MWSLVISIMWAMTFICCWKSSVNFLCSWSRQVRDKETNWPERR